MKRLFFFITASSFLFLASCTSNKAQDKTGKPSQMKVEYIEGTSGLLGEGSIWDYRKNVLFWIDIQGMKLLEYNPETGNHSSWDLYQNVGTIVPESDNSVIVALKDGLYRKSFSPDTMEFIARPTSLKIEERFNDGKCDPSGRLWVGAMRVKGKAGDSKLYRYEPSTGFTEMIDSVSISNGITWSLDGSKMYYIDTPTRQIIEYVFDNRKGDISNGRIAVQIADTLGHPDGMTIDAEGKLWVGMWGGNAVCRFDPDTGELIDRIEVPARNVTSCAFGGENLETLYITTASVGMTEELKRKYPHAGGLFKVKPGVKGVKVYYFSAE